MVEDMAVIPGAPVREGVGAERLLERDQLPELLTAVDSLADSGTALVISGSAGSGKTALLGAVAARAERNGYQVLRCTGLPADSATDGTALHELLYPVLGRVQDLPSVHRSALHAWFGIDERDRPTPAAVGLATLHLVEVLASDTPVLVAVDDLQWVDPLTAEALSFVVRRLRNAPILVAAAQRDSAAGRDRAWPGQRVALAPLSSAAAEVLVARSAPALTPAESARVVAEAGGNPLALVELARGLAERPENHRDEDSLLLTRRLARSLLADVDRLAPQTRLFLLLAAADERDSLPELLAAAARLDLRAEAIDPAEREGVVSVHGGRVRFAQPLLRRAIYGAAAWTERAEVHAALASSTDDPVRAVWHRTALAATGDETAARELEESSLVATGRGDLDAAVRLLRRSAALSAGPGVANRLATAAELARQAGHGEEAATLVEEAVSLSPAPEVLGSLMLTRSVLTLTTDLPGSTGADELASMVAVLADQQRAGTPSPVGLLAAASLAWNLQPAAAVQERLLDLLAAADLDEKGPVDAGPSPSALIAMSRIAVDALAGADVGPRLGSLVEALQEDALGDDAGRRRRACQVLIATARAAESLHDLPTAARGWDLADAAASVPHRSASDQARLLAARALNRVLTGRLGDALAETARAAEASRELGLHRLAELTMATQALTEAWTSDRSAEETAHAAAPRRGYSSALALATGRWAAGLALLREDRYDEAWQHLADTDAHPMLARNAVADLVEAACGTGDAALVAVSTSRLEDVAEAAEVLRSAHLRALVLRSQALLDLGDPHERFRESARMARRAGARLELGRTLLAHGDWLRRQGRIVAAREQLGEANFVLSRAGAAPWAAISTRALRAAGVGPATRTAEVTTVADLSPRELQIARLAAAGMTNKEIAARLSCSPRTVGAYLYRTYPKLGVTGRAQLPDALGARDGGQL